MPQAGEIFRQPDLAATLRKLVETEKQALGRGKSRKDAILAAYDRFYRGDIAQEFVRGSREVGGLHTVEDLANWKVRIEEPVKTSYKGIDVYKLDVWTQGPAMLQALNILETIDPYPFQGEENPFKSFLERWKTAPARREAASEPAAHLLRRDAASSTFEESSFSGSFFAGTTSVEAADAEGWVVSVTPSGGWLPAVIAGKTGIGMSQRMQSFVLDPAENPFNVLEPGKHPRVTLTPTLALKDGKPYLCFSVQGGDSQDQNLLQFFLNVAEFGMSVQEASEAADINSYQMRSSFGAHESRPGAMMISASLPAWVRGELTKMGYKLEPHAKTSGPINAIFLDREHGTMSGGSSDQGEDYGIGW